MAFTKVTFKTTCRISILLNLYSQIRTRYGISPENIILYGQSIGTVPTVDLASRYEVGAVVLHSALMSGMRVAFPNTKRTWFFDVFPSIDKVSKITSPVLVIHGTEDEVIGTKLFASYQKINDFKKSSTGN